MKARLLLVILCLLTTFSFCKAQSDSLPENPYTKQKEPYTIVEKKPVPQGGLAGWSQYLQSQMKYPKDARRLGIVGRVYVQFIVEKDGKTSNIKVLKGIGAPCDSMAAKVVRNSPPWQPGEQDGEPVRVRMVVPIVYALSGYRPFAEYKDIKPANWEEFTKLRSKPVVKGGMDKLQAYLEENFEFPEEARKAEEGGTVLIQFTIFSDGKIGDVKPLTEFGYGLEEAGVKLVSNMPAWEPGYISPRKTANTDLIIHIPYWLEASE